MALFFLLAVILRWVFRLDAHYWKEQVRSCARECRRCEECRSIATCDFCDITTNKWRIPLVAIPPPVVVWDYTNNIFYALGEKHSKKRVFTEGKRQRIEKKIPFLSFRIYLYFIGVSNRHLTSAEKQINKMGGIDACVSSVATVGFNYNNPLFASYCTQSAAVLHTTRLNRRLLS